MHEAGHAVIAWLCGWRIRLVSTLEDGKTAGRVTYDSGPQGQSILQHALARARFTVAGEVAYAIQLGYIALLDIRLWVEHHNELPPNFPSEWLDALLYGVKEDLQSNWPRVERLAEALLERRELSGAEATAILAR